MSPSRGAGQVQEDKKQDEISRNAGVLLGCAPTRWAHLSSEQGPLQGKRCFVHSGVRRVGDSGGWTKGRVHQTGADPSPGQASGPVSGGSQVPPAGQRVAVRGFPW